MYIPRFIVYYGFSAILLILFLFSKKIYQFIQSLAMSCRFKRDHRLTSLMAYVATTQKNDEEGSGRRYKYLNDKHEIVCSIDSKTFHGMDGQSPSITLIGAIELPPHLRGFGDIIADQSMWPNGVGYVMVDCEEFGVKTGSSRVNIIVYVDIDFKDDPQADLLGYIAYLEELQLDLVKRLNDYKVQIDKI